MNKNIDIEKLAKVCGIEFGQYHGNCVFTYDKVSPETLKHFGELYHRAKCEQAEAVEINIDAIKFQEAVDAVNADQSAELARLKEQSQVDEFEIQTLKYKLTELDKVKAQNEKMLEALKHYAWTDRTESIAAKFIKQAEATT